jgi:flagellar FliL protein
MASTAAAKAPAEVPAAPAKKSKLPLIIILVVVLLAGAGAAAWFFLMQDEAEDEEPKPSDKPAVFLPVDQFTVNLQPEDGQQFLQVAMTLKVVDQSVSDAIKAQMPEVRSRVLLLLSSKKPSQLISVEGKNTLAEEIAKAVEAPLPAAKAKERKKPKKKSKSDAEGKDGKKTKSKGKPKVEEAQEEPAPPRVLSVFFTHFIVQ